MAFHSFGTCLASPEGFNPKLEPINSGVAWTTTLTGIGSVNAHGAATEIGQAVDTASFGVGPRMHIPAARSYKVSFTATINKQEKDGSSTFRAGASEATGSFTAGPYAGRSLTLSAFQLKRNSAEKIYGSVDTPLLQTVFLGGGVKFERICVIAPEFSFVIRGHLRSSSFLRRGGP
jgi:hypothetical protein